MYDFCDSDNLAMPYMLFFSCLHRSWTDETKRKLLHLTDENWSEFSSIVTQRGMAPLFFHYLKVNEMSEQIPHLKVAHLQKQYHANALRNLQLNHSLNMILGKLQERDIPIVLLKGIHLATSVYDNIALRRMADIDLLVRPKDLENVAAVLQQLGYVQAFQRTTGPQSSSDHHLSPFLHPSNNCQIEIHWTIAPPNSSYHFDIDSIWSNAQSVMIGQHNVLALSPEDLLLHICWHTTYHHRFEQGVRSLCDVDAIVWTYKDIMDWELILARAKAWKWERGLYLMLYLANHWLSTPFPAIVEANKPPDLTSMIVKDATAQILADRESREMLSGNFINLWRTKSWRDRLDLFRQRLFRPRQSMEQMYAPAVTQRFYYFHYWRRFAELLKRYGGMAWHLLLPRSQTAIHIKHQVALIDWLENSSDRGPAAEADSRSSESSRRLH